MEKDKIPKEVWKEEERKWIIEKMETNVKEAKKIINDTGKSNKRKRHNRTSRS